LRQGFSTQPNELLLINLTVLKSALDRSIQDNIIPRHLRDEIPGYLQTFHQFRLTREQEPSTDPAYPTLKDRFGNLFTDDKLLTLAKADADHPTFSKEWEHSIKEKGFEAKDITTIQTTYLLGGLTQNNHALAQTLHRRFELEAPSDLRKLVSLDRADWDSLATRHGITTEQRDLYVKNIVTALDVSFTGAVMARELEKNQLDVPEDARPLLKQFFRNNPAFEFDTHYVTPFLAEGGAANLTGIEVEQIPLFKERDPPAGPGEKAGPKLDRLRSHSISQRIAGEKVRLRTPHRFHWPARLRGWNQRHLTWRRSGSHSTLRSGEPQFHALTSADIGACQ
jgi:hypothetical protein